ncbi:diphosphate--fructose-6-phosphate 1-phosphotransferase [Desulfocarbo indianensis]|nr:diphosphate--fructose-6-phosphate 1-phosphotransferase [Desulfocarbo indianensis]
MTEIAALGPAKIPNPIVDMSAAHEKFSSFVSDGEGINVDPFLRPGRERSEVFFEHAGPRSHIYFDPSKLKAAIVTCGGLCPGINSLVRAIVLQLHYIYKVRNIVGMRYGLQGFIPSYGHELVELIPETVQDIHGRGGSFLGMSRGGQAIEEVVDTLERLNIGVLFMIGGDGTLRAAKQIYEEITERKLKTGVVAIPKTIDNDIGFVERTFGFQTAVEAAAQAILGAHNEATGAPHGIGLVKLMGRHAGFVAAFATLALSDVNYCLIPEADFDLEGPEGLLSALEQRLQNRGHAVVVVAEGAGQKYFKNGSGGEDASGNVKLGDIGVYLRDGINAHFAAKGREITLKYMDPSYLIRSMPANSNDRIYTGFLAHSAVHAALAGKTGMMVSLWGNHNVHVPIELAISYHAQVDPDGGLWRAVREATGQPPLKNSPPDA